MQRGLFYFFKLSLFWLLFFTLYKLAFILTYLNLIPEGKYAQAFSTFLYGLRLDTATIGYLVAIPLILWSILQFFKNNFLNKINHIYNLLMITANTLICLSNIDTYGEWHSLIGYDTLYYLVAPAKMFPYMTTLELVVVCLSATLIIALFILLFRVMILMVVPYSTNTITHKLMLIPALFPVLFIIMRGGTQCKPININFSCYSDSKFIDDVSINPVWHLGHLTLVAIKQPQKTTVSPVNTEK